MSDEIRVGDRFEIAVEVRRVYTMKPGLDRCVVTPVGSPLDEVNDITSDILLSGRRLPKPINVGDRVNPKNPPKNDGPWSVVAVHDEWAWCRNPRSDSGWLFRLSDLTPIPGDQS